jgi:fibrillarin-like rRNA methylase
MQPTEHPGIYKKNDKLFTRNPETCKGVKVYNEQLINEDGYEYRSWNPFRSKLAAALLKGLKIDIPVDAQILYLGAATGTTVSHLSDIITNGTLYAVESSPVATINLLNVSEKRSSLFLQMQTTRSAIKVLSPLLISFTRISPSGTRQIFSPVTGTRTEKRMEQE